MRINQFQMKGSYIYIYTVALFESKIMHIEFWIYTVYRIRFDCEKLNFTFEERPCASFWSEIGTYILFMNGSVIYLQHHIINVVKFLTNNECSDILSNNAGLESHFMLKKTFHLNGSSAFFNFARSIYFLYHQRGRMV